MQAAEMSFLSRVAGLRNRVRSLDIQEELDVEPIECFDHVIRIISGHIPLEIFLEELESVAGERDAWNTLLSLLPPLYKLYTVTIITQPNQDITTSLPLLTKECYVFL